MLRSRFLSVFILAVFLCNLGLESDKGNVLSQIYYLKGARALNKGEYPEAIAKLRKALEISPESKKIKRALATALNNYSQSLPDDEIEKSIELIEESVEICPEEEQLKKNLAVQYTNCGLKLQEKGDLAEAIEKFKKSIDLYPEEDKYQENLGRALNYKANGCFKKGEFEEAVRTFSEARQYIPENFYLWIMLGESYYKLDRLEEAIDCWGEAEKLSPENQILKQKLAKAKKEWPVQKDFRKFSSSYFQVNFSPDFSRDKAYEVYNYVKEAIWSIGRDFGVYPKEKFSVFVYQSGEFNEIFDEREHIGGVYDGKVHLHINERTSSERMSEIIRHEYTHAVIFWTTHGRCPVWLNEGLACFEEKKDKPVDFSGLKKLARQNKLLPLSELSAACYNLKDLGLSNLAYKEAHNLVKYIIAEYGFWQVRKMLALFGEGKKEPDVIKEVLHLEPETLERDWQKKLLYE